MLSRSPQFPALSAHAWVAGTIN